MSHLASAKAQRDLHLVAFLEELSNRSHFYKIIVLVDVRPQFDFLDLNGLLFFPCLGRFFLSLEFIFSKIHDLANRDFSSHCNFDEIEASLLGPSQCVTLADGAMIFPILIDELNVASDDRFVNAGPFLGGRTSNRTAYDDSPLAVSSRAARNDYRHSG